MLENHEILIFASKFKFFFDQNLDFVLGSNDNKQWMNNESTHAIANPTKIPKEIREPATNGYEKLFGDDATCVPDMAYWFNYHAEKHLVNVSTINAAVEATTLQNRSSVLIEQDRFARQHLEDGDHVVCSIGGNDIALAPTGSTIGAMIRTLLNPSRKAIGRGSSGAMQTLISLFKDGIQNYLIRVIGKKKVSKVFVNMIYYPAIEGDSWCKFLLSVINNRVMRPRLQFIIRNLFLHATSQITIPGVEIIPVPMFEILDHTNSIEYDNRVEPSSVGGNKISAKIMEVITRGITREQLADKDSDVHWEKFWRAEPKGWNQSFAEKKHFKKTSGMFKNKVRIHNGSGTTTKVKGEWVPWGKWRGTETRVDTQPMTKKRNIAGGLREPLLPDGAEADENVYTPPEWAGDQ